MEQSLTILFEYGLPDDRPFYDLSDRFFQLFDKNTIGEYDGHEIEMNNADGSYFFFGPDANAIFEAIEPILKEYAFLKGARIIIRNGDAKENLLIRDFIFNAPPAKEPSLFSNMHSINPIPHWDDEHFADLRKYRRDDDEGDEWKHQMKDERAANLYNQWRQVYSLLQALAASLQKPEAKPGEETDEHLAYAIESFDEQFIEDMTHELLDDSMIIPAKIRGAEAADIYVQRMENAAIIRQVANTIQQGTANIKMMKVASDEDIDLVRDEIDKFRELFKEWVAGFEKDEFEDEWGLF